MRLSLASALALIGRDAAAIDSRADAVLRIVKQAKMKTAKEFNAAVRVAYERNGWNSKPGKPKAGNKKVPVPATVKQYVSTIRRAFKMDLLVLTYSSFYALRSEVQAKAAKARKPREEKKPEMQGVSVSRPDVLTGAVFHDLAVLYDALDKKRQAAMTQALDRVKRQFQPAAPKLVVLEPVVELKKAA